MSLLYVRVGLPLSACLAAGFACTPRSAEPSEPPADAPVADPPTPPSATTRLTVRVEDETGRALGEALVTLRGGYDTRPRSIGETDARGQVELSLDSPGIVFVTLGESGRAIVHYGSTATKDTVVVFVDGPTELRLRSGPQGVAVASGDHEVWPVTRSNERMRGYIAELAKAARGSTSEPEGMMPLVDRQWAEIRGETNERMRKLLTIHYATFASQAVGPGRFADLLELVDPSDRAWVVQSTHVLELIWVMDDDAWRDRLISTLRRHHDDPGLRSVLTLWDLKQAASAGDQRAVLELYRALEHPRYAATIAWRNARKYDPERGISIGRTLPAFSVQRTNDASAFTEADLAGKAWVLQVWTTWCTPCVEELAALPDLYEGLAEYRSELDFVSISLDDERALTLRTLEAHHVPWTSTWAPDSETFMKSWGFSGVPLTLLVDRTGTIVKVWDRAASNRSIRTAAVKLLGER